MGDLNGLWEKLSLIDKEDDELEIIEEWSSLLRGRGHLCVTMKVLSNHRFSCEALKQTLHNIWRISKGMSFTDAPDGLLLVEFFDVGDKDQVLIGRPWSFERCLLLVTPLEGDVQPSKLEMNLVPFWVQIHDLPLLYMNREVGECVGGILGSVLLVDTDENGVGWGKSLRVRVQLDVSQPLLRGKKIRLGGQSLWIYFKYERLPMFCYGCGRLWHGGGGCPVAASSKRKFSETVQYGPWLRAVDDNSSSRSSAPSKATVSRVNSASLGDAAENTVERTVERTAETGGKEIVPRQFLRNQSSPSSCLVIDGEVVVHDHIMRGSYEDKEASGAEFNFR
jgi:hypothetical protein